MLQQIEQQRIQTIQEVDNHEHDERIPWGRLIKYLVITVVGMFGLMIFVDKVAMPWYVKLGAVETVSDVTGMTFAEAQEQLEKDGFEVKRGEPRFSDKFAAGMVMMQLPYGGAQTKQGRRIYLMVSRGSEMSPMLNLIGMPMREARISLMRKGLDIGEVIYEYNDTIMRDLVFAQSIPPNIGVRPATLVDVVISKGPSTRFTLMPNLIALDVETARVRVENAGLVLGIVRYVEDETYIPNTVISQAVEPYSRVAEGGAINITIAKAPGTAPVGPLPQEHSGSSEKKGEVMNLPKTPTKPASPNLQPR